MLHTTFAKAKEAGACESSYRKMGKVLGGINQYGKDTPIPLDKVLDVLGLQDTIWAMRATMEPAEDILIEFSCRCAEHVLHFYTDKYPCDNRPQNAIDCARRCITDKSQSAWDAAGAARDAARDAAGAAAGAAARAARDAAWDAARDAAWAAARDAAWAAAWDADWAAWDAAWDAARAAGAAAGAARDAAWAAAWDADWAAWDATRAAAWAAARAAELKWQTETLRGLLK